jgi:hypothetical protein
MFLSKLPNCDSKKRMDAWRASGGALLGNKNIGCGINSLVFLGVFTRKEGDDLVRIINPRGTTFLEMMNFVAARSGGNIQREVIFPITTVAQVQDFISHIKRNLGNNSCTVAKMMRYPDNSTPVYCKGILYTSGHSVIFGVENNTLYAIDPQQDSFRESEDADKALKAWGRTCYTHAHVMYSGGVLQNANDVSVPMEIEDDYITFPDHNATVPMEIEGGKKYRTKKYRTKKYRTKKNKFYSYS